MYLVFSATLGSLLDGLGGTQYGLFHGKVTVQQRLLYDTPVWKELFLSCSNWVWGDDAREKMLKGNCIGAKIEDDTGVGKSTYTDCNRCSRTMTSLKLLWALTHENIWVIQVKHRLVLYASVHTLTYQSIRHNASSTPSNMIFTLKSLSIIY